MKEMDCHLKYLTSFLTAALFADDVQIKIAIYDWDIVRKSASLGSLILDINEEGQLDAAWHTLSSDSGQVITMQSVLVTCNFKTVFSRFSIIFWYRSGQYFLNCNYFSCRAEQMQ